MAILIITRGGDLGVDITELAAGPRHGATATEATPAPTYMAGGAMRLTPTLALPGRSRIPATRVARVERHSAHERGHGGSSRSRRQCQHLHWEHCRRAWGHGL